MYFFMNKQVLPSVQCASELSKTIPNIWDITNDTTKTKNPENDLLLHGSYVFVGKVDLLFSESFALWYLILHTMQFFCNLLRSWFKSKINRGTLFYKSS